MPTPSDGVVALAGPAPKQTMAERLTSKHAKSAQREQEDAHEFFNFLVDATHEELLRLRAANAQLLGEQGKQLNFESMIHHHVSLNLYNVQCIIVSVLVAVQCSRICRRCVNVKRMLAASFEHACCLALKSGSRARMQGCL